MSLSWIAALSGSVRISPKYWTWRRTKPQFLARGRAVVGVEDAGQRFRPKLPGERAFEIAGVELVQLDRIERAGVPQPQRINALAAPADHRRVEGDRLHRFGGRPVAAAVGQRRHLAAEADEIGAFPPLELPRVAVREPGFGQLDLPAVVQPLAEHAVHVADAIAIGRQVEAREAFHETRGQPPEAAVAEGRVRLDLFDHR